MKSTRICILLIMISISLQLNAQKDPNEGNFRFFSMKMHTGKHLYTGLKLKDKLTHGYGSLELRTGWQTKGKHAWEKSYNFPSYGIGWYSGYIGDIDIFGNPNALFGFITFPVTHGKKLIFQVEPAIGLTYNLKPFNPQNNALNDAIGARAAVYFALHGGGKVHLNREVDFLYGADLTHFSNGRTFTPNLGLNMFGLSTGFRYNFNGSQKKIDKSLHPAALLEARPTFPKSEKPEKIREDNISIFQAIGTVQNRIDAGTHKRYVTSSTLIEYQHKFNTMHAVTVGFDAFHDPSAKDTAENHTNLQQKSFFPAAHIGYDFMFWRLTIKFQLGFNLSSIGKELKGNTFIRPAVRYEINRRLFTQLGLKTFKGASADWIELGLGYKVVYSRRKKS